MRHTRWKTIPVGYSTDALIGPAKALAERLNTVLDNQALPRLSLTPDRLELLVEGFAPLFVDFSTKAWRKRRGAGKKQGLVRACKPAKGSRIMDATAGWGRDAIILASFGADVFMIERNPVMGALLTDALNRDLSSLSGSLSLCCMDAKLYCQALSPQDYPDVIYIDPMHPLRQKSALVKKDMQALQRLLGMDHDAHELIQIARVRARQRVVVKWPQRLASIWPPDASVLGKTVRFDVYRTYAKLQDGCKTCF